MRKKMLGVSTPDEAYNLIGTDPMYRGIYYEDDEFTLTSGWNEIEYYVTDNIWDEPVIYPCFAGLMLLLSIDWESYE